MKIARTLVGVALVVAGAVVLSACGQQAAPSPKGFKTINFDFDRYDVRASEQGKAKENAAAIQGNPGKRVTVEGHCDERGSTEYNIALGDRRAKSTKSYLQNLGVAGDRLSTISYGEERPVCTDHSENCWWRNRRAEFRW